MNGREAFLGYFAISKAGHDKGKLYVVVGEEEKLAYLCDGRLHPLAKPKKKNLRHVQPVSRPAEPDLPGRLLKKETVSDEQIRYAIKQYCNRQPPKTI
ncbi:MAG: KOW domain-containing RNA-binding protein [Clostridium sp.]|jgi:ribosomal protein L14E/L6E/L27E|nr:KOW domain-containing RNA-binding protein [Clostridium sp.]